MSKQNILLKGSKNRISISLDKNAKFEDLKKELADKFKEDKEFWGKSKIALEFKERKLSLKEEKELLDIITNNSELDIVYIIDDNDKKDETIFNMEDNKGLIKVVKSIKLYDKKKKKKQ